MTTLGALAVTKGIQTGPFGSQLHAHEYAASGVGVVMPQDIGENILDFVNMARIPAEKAADLGRHELEPGDIVYSRRGDVTRRSLVRESDPPMICGTGCLRVRLDRTKANPMYVSYALGQRDVRAWITRHAVGATMLNLNTGILAAVPLDVPPKAQQDAIAEVLGALDDKIAVNRKVMDTAWCLAEALVARPLRESTTVTTLEAVSETITRGVAPKYVDEGGYRVLNQKCVRGNRVLLEPSRRMSALPNDLGKVLRRGDVLVNSTGQGTLGRVARWTRDEESVSVDSHISIVRVDDSVADPDFVGVVLCGMENTIEGLAEGSTGQTELRRAQLAALPLMLPDAATQRAVGTQIRKLSDHADALAAENETLAKTRDELLPLLMSGKITVKDAEKRVEGVV